MLLKMAADNIFKLSYLHFNTIVRRSSYNFMLAKSWHDLCFEESTFHETVIDVLMQLDV